MIDTILATFVLWLMGAPIYLPGLLARLGIYKSWYLIRPMPPFAWRGIVYMWPFSAIFVCAPFMSLLPLNEDERLQVLVGISVVGAIFAIILGIWRPRWAKPVWQRRLEDRYSQDEIARFVRVWREMDRKEWGRLIETEEGLKQLVEMAGGQYRAA